MGSKCAKDRATGCLFVDVDGTLLIWPTKPGSPQPGETPKVNERLVAAIRHWAGPGRTLVVWSMGGVEHAQMAAELCGLSDAVCLAKPEYMVDDAEPDLFGKKHRPILPQDFVELFGGQ